MRRSTSSAEVMTVLGGIPADQLGVTLIHEHLFWDLRSLCIPPSVGKLVSSRPDCLVMENLGLLHRDPFCIEENLGLDEVWTIGAEVMAFKRAGGSTIVDATSIGMGREPDLLRELARTTGLNIVMGCGYYRSLAHDAFVLQSNTVGLADQIIKDLKVGVGEERIRAGMIGEIGTSAPLNPEEQKVLTAAAYAQKETGAALCVHVHPWTSQPTGLQILDLLAQAGADLSKVILNHLDCCLDLDYHEELLRRGVYITYDNFGKEYHRDRGHIQYPTDLQRLESLAELISRGYLERLMVSQDVCFRTDLRRYGGWGYDHLLTNIIPLARHIGFSQKNISTILIENPSRALSV